MKKTHLLAATALVTTLMLGAPAFAADHAAHIQTTPKAATVKTTETKAAKPMQGPMHDVMMEMKEENKETMAEMQAKREELHKIAAAPTFDKDAYLAKHEEMQALHAKMAKARAEAMADKLAAMTPEQRAKLPEMMGQRPHGMKMMGQGPMGGKMEAAKPAAEVPAKSQ